VDADWLGRCRALWYGGSTEIPLNDSVYSGVGVLTLATAERAPFPMEVLMGAAFFIVLDRKDPGFDTMVNGKALSQDARRLEKIAKSLGIRPLEEYVSYEPDEAREMMEEMGTDPDEIDDMELPEQKWYEAQEGLEWVTKIGAHIRANPSSVKNAEDVLADLDAYRAVLEQAKSIKARWNLQVDF
jgi:hypothetical protein